MTKSKQAPAPSAAAAARQQKTAAAKEKAKKEERAIIQSSTALQPFGTAEELAILIKRFKFMIPHAEKLNDGQIMALAHSAIAYGLDPVVRQCCWIPGSGFYPMIAGTRKLGREFFTNTYKDPRSNLTYDRITTAADLELYAIPPGALAFKCKGEVTALVQAWTASGNEIRQALGDDAPWEAVKEMMGPRPATIGIGYITAEEMWEKDNPRWWHECKKKENNTEPFKGRPMQYVLRGHDDCPDCGKASWATVNRYPHTQCAQKRSEAHWWKQAADLTFQIKPSGEGLADDGMVIDGVAYDVSDIKIPDSIQTPEELALYMELRASDHAAEAERAALSPEELKERTTKGATTLYGDDPPATPVTIEHEPAPTNGPSETAEQFKTLFRAAVAEASGTRKNESLLTNAAILMKQIFSDDNDRHAAQLFLAGKASLSDFTGAELVGLLKVLKAKPSKQDKKKHIVNPIAHQSMRQCAAAMAKA